LEPSLKDKLSLGKPYVIHKIARKTTWVFLANRPVFQLIDPEGAVFFMQSYSVQKEKQTDTTLPNLASKLSLPKGWKVRTLTIKKDYQVQAVKGMAYVTQDDLDNTYQKSSAKETDSL
jgi:hypothetical protein